MKKAVILFASLVLSVVACAQMPDMTPPEELKFFDFMNGTWTGTMKWTMEGMNMDVSTTLKVEREGQFVKMTSEFDMAGAKMSEVQYLGWDKAKKQFVAHSFTNFSPSPRIERGTVTGDKLVTISEPWVVWDGEPAVVGRATIAKKGDKEVEILLEFKDGEKWNVVATTIMKKKG